MVWFKKQRLYIAPATEVPSTGGTGGDFSVPPVSDQPATGEPTSGDTVETPVQTEGATPGLEEPGQTTPQSEGEPTLPEETAGESTILADGYSYETTTSDANQSTLPATDDSSSMLPEDRDLSSSFDDLVKRAEAGDEDAKLLLEQWTNKPADQGEELSGRMEKSRFMDEGEREKEQDLYKKAVSYDTLLATLEKKARAEARSLPRSNPIREQLLTQADQFKAQRQQFHSKLKSFEQRLADAKQGDMRKQYEALLKQKKDGTLTPEQAKQLKSYERRFGSFTAGRADLYQKRAAKGIEKEINHTRKETASSTKKALKAQVKEAKKEIKDKEAELEQASRIPEPTDPEVEVAARTVAARLGGDEIERNKEKAARRQAFLSWAREKKSQIESGEYTGEAAMAYSVLYASSLSELTGGAKQGRVAGLRFLTGGVRRELEGERVHPALKALSAGSRERVEGRSSAILSARPGDQEFYKNRAALTALYQQPDAFRSDDEGFNRVPVLRFFGGLAARLQRTRGLGGVRL